MHRYDIIRLYSPHFVNCGLNYRVKNPACQMEASEHRMNLIFSCNFLCVLDCIDNSGMGTAADDYKPFALQFYYQPLIIPERISNLVPIKLCLSPGESLFKCCCAFHHPL